MEADMSHYAQIYETARLFEQAKKAKTSKILKDPDRPKPKYIEYDFYTGEYSYSGKVGNYFIYTTYVPADTYFIISNVLNVDDYKTIMSAYAKFYFNNVGFDVILNFDCLDLLKDENFTKALLHAHEVCSEVIQCHEYLVNFGKKGCCGGSCKT